jgi:putative transposase
MAIAQLSGRCSLRDIIKYISAQAHRLYHLDSVKLARTNLSHIDDSKHCELHKALLRKLLHRCQGVFPGHAFRFSNLLYLLDAPTIIDVCLFFPSADYRYNEELRL